MILFVINGFHLFSQQYVCDPTPNTSNIYPFQGSATNNLRQWIYHPSDFPGIPSGNITDIYFKANAAGNVSFTNLTIKIGFTTLASFPNGTFVTGLQTVYNAAYTGTTMAGNYVKVTLQTPFAYNNTQNIVIEASQTGYSPGFGILQGTATAYSNRSIFGGATATSGTIQSRLGNIGLDVSTVSQSDVGVATILSPNGVFCSGQQSVMAIIENHANAPINNIPVMWSINGVAQTPYTYVGTLEANNSTTGIWRDTVILGNAMFANGNSNIKVWTDVMNDVDRLNDTALASVSPTNFTLTAQMDTLCPGKSTNLLLLPNFGYNANDVQWQESTNGNTFTNMVTAPTFTLNTGNLTTTKHYRVLVSSGQGCYSNTATVNVVNAAIQVDLGSDTSVCSPNSIVLNAGNTGASYLWQDSSTNQTLLADTPGKYFVTVTNPAGCSASDTMELMWNAPPTADFYANNWGGSNLATYTISARLENVVRFFWDFGDGSPQSTMNPVNHTYPANGNYEIKLHIFNDCGDEVVLKKKVDAYVGLEDVAIDNAIELYPNPTTSYVNIKTASGINIERVVVTNALGAHVLSADWSNGSQTLDIAKLPSGIYTMEVYTNKGTMVRKVLKL